MLTRQTEVRGHLVILRGQQHRKHPPICRFNAVKTQQEQDVKLHRDVPM